VSLAFTIHSPVRPGDRHWQRECTALFLVRLDGPILSSSTLYPEARGAFALDASAATRVHRLPFFFHLNADQIARSRSDEAASQAKRQKPFLWPLSIVYKLELAETLSVTLAVFLHAPEHWVCSSKYVSVMQTWCCRTEVYHMEHVFVSLGYVFSSKERGKSIFGRWFSSSQATFWSWYFSFSRVFGVLLLDEQ
jgi:hypothetical protein